LKISSYLKNRWIKRFLILAGSCIIIMILIAGIFVWLFIPWIPDTDFPTPANNLEAYTQDLNYLVEYSDYEKAFDDSVKKRQFINYIETAKKDLKGMTPARFELVVARAIAIADNGHTNVSPIGIGTRVNHFPIRTGPFEDGEFVIQATKENADLLGAEILEVESHSIKSVTDSFVPFFGGIERRSRFFTHLFIMSPDLLNAQGFSKSSTETELTFRLADSTIVKRTLSGIKPVMGKREPFGREVMDYRVPKGDQNSWVHLMQDYEQPPYLKDPDKPYLYEFLEKEKGAYVKINYNMDMGEYSLAVWLEFVAQDLKSRKPNFAIIDLRFNGGGTDATASFSKELPNLVQNNAPIYILVSRETFSAAIAAAAQFKKYGGSRTIILGSEVGDRLRFVANGGTVFTLPNSKINIRVWSAYEDYENGCWDWTECFWLSPFFREAGVGNLNPHKLIPLQYRDYSKNTDPVFEYAVQDGMKVKM
jgi:hypothetical protein